MRDTLVLQPHPVCGTLAAEKFTEGMTPAMASVFPGQNGPAGVAGDFGAWLALATSPSCTSRPFNFPSATNLHPFVSNLVLVFVICFFHARTHLPQTKSICRGRSCARFTRAGH